jgi:hypothetical protein
MADGLSLDPTPFDPGPLAVRGQVHIDSGTNIATVVGMTPGSFADVTGPVFFGLNVAGPAAPFFMTPTQSTAILNQFTSALQGLVPGSGGGTTNFLRADGTWAPPPGGGSAHTIRVNGSSFTARTGLNFLNGTGITASGVDDAGGNETEVTFSLASNGVTNTIANDMPALTVKANATNATADPQDVAASADDTVFRRTSTTLNWGQLTVGMAPNDLWTYAKIQNVVNNNRFLGRISGAGGDIEELTGTQATTLLDVFTSALKGLAPASGGGTTNFLRADGTWAAPPDTNTGHVIRINGASLTQRSFVNFLNTTTINVTGLDDAGSNESEVSFTLNAHTGDVTSAANSLALTIANNAVTNAKANDMAANTVKVNPTAATADPQDMSVPTNTFVGRLASNIQTLTGTQATTLLDTFTSALKGLAPASGGGTTNFLRADGTWAAPPSTLAGHIIRDNGASATQRSGLNFLSSSEIDPVIGDDAVGNETEVSFSLINASVALARLANGTALSVVCRPVNSAGVHSDLTSSLDDTFLRRTGATLNWGGLTNAMVPSQELTAEKLASVTEQEITTAGLTSDLVKTDAATRVFMFSNTAATSVDGIDSTDVARGYPITIHKQGTGSLDVLDANGTGGGVSTATNTFAHYRNKNIRLRDDEAACYIPADLTAGGTNAKRYLCVSHRWPFHNSDELLDKQKIAYNDTTIDWDVTHSLQKSMNTCEFWDDFLGCVNDDPELNLTSVAYQTGDCLWFARASGANLGDILFISSELNHPGIMRMTVAATDNAAMTVHRMPFVTSNFCAGQEILDFEAVVRFTDFGLGSVGCFIGFGEDVSSLSITTTANSNIVAFMYDTDNASLTTSLRCVTREADGTATVTASGVAPTGWKRLRILQRTVGTIEFYIDDNLVATHTTQTPDTELMNLGMTLVTRSAASRTMDVDLVNFISHPLTRA